MKASDILSTGTQAGTPAQSEAKLGRGVLLQPAQIWQEYEKGQSYKRGISLYENVSQNENFYLGNQWEGVSAPDLDKPVMNILKRVVSYFLSHIVSDDVGVGVSEGEENRDNQGLMSMLGAQFANIMEQTACKRKFRDALRNAAVDGDGCLHFYFDTELGHGVHKDATPGGISAEILENTAVFFGNPQMAEVQKQPYILLAFRRYTADVQESANLHGGQAEAIVDDGEIAGMEKTQAAEAGKVTVIRKYFRKDGTIWFTDVAAGGVVCPPQNTGYRLYPLAWMSWEKIKNSYHGQAAITGLIPNQIFINKLLAMAMQHVKMMAFPKIIYNKNVFPAGWSNKVGAALGVNGDPNQAVATSFRSADMSNQVLLMFDRVVQYTKDTMGASDAALGNIAPQNTSAIVATQKATSMPLELQKMEFYQLVEDSVRIWLDMMAQNYGVRHVRMQVGEEEGLQSMMFDFSSLRSMELKLNIDIGAATYWSELMQIQTLDNLFANKIIDDPVLYLEMVPATCLPGKQRILEEVKKRQAALGAKPMQGEALGSM